MRTKPPALLPLFRSELQARLLTLLVEDPRRWWTASELRELVGGAPSTLHAELHRLEDAALVEREQLGRVHRFRAAADSPLYKPLRELVEASIGVEAELKKRLATTPGVEAGAIFGSWAAGDLEAGSDIDVIVVGNFDRAALARAMRNVEDLAQRDVQLVMLTRREFRDRLRRRSGVVRSISQRPITPLVGDMQRMIAP
jgi:predicted nucleotidyltransferase